MTVEKIIQASSSSNFFYYFAFGSNLLKERINVQIKGAVFETVGVLKDFQLCFFDHTSRWRGAVASIEPKIGAEVYGCVWRVPNDFAEELDLQEAVYHRLHVPILVPGINQNGTNNKELMCRTYQYSNIERKQQPPSPHYKLVIVSGAIEHSLPIQYINQLKEIVDNGYCGPIELDLKVLHELNGKMDYDNQEKPWFGK